MRYLLALAAVIAALSFAGSMDLQDAQNHAGLYCQFVADGTWPAYDPQINCEK